ncbi:sugar nucleotide-binding protein [Robiginitalea sp. M366]|uniref:sugar nucleotide-binding protein n=1 Tax=Robiginitalea aestuariiviva TaxID=3036903 RepID=UPI00240D2E03|nr:sugar nucleotide-binding protein [Robiginitalea aestuariiviva]MDG1572630.1 sugar nucleotide-binding protein [Robiginitalea aestuariiviva]
MADTGKRILILGGSGFLGHALYKELCPYFDTYATYCSARRRFEDNAKFLRYDMQEDDIFPLLEEVKPQVIISAVRGDFGAQIQAHAHLVEYLAGHQARMYFLSSANVFDAYSKYPSYELDKTLSESVYGRLKIRIENMLLRLPQERMGIIRLPMVFGNASPRTRELLTALKEVNPIEVFPNLIMNVTSDDKLCQQLHYMINRDKHGIFHLGSRDLVHHEDFIGEICSHLSENRPIFKRVYTTNDERYLAVLPKHSKLPKNLQYSYQEVIDMHISQ